MSLSDLALRRERYLAAPISTEISEHDDMLDSGIETYLAVGRSAVESMLLATCLSGKASVGSILDLPCGCGRVTRHIRAAFPEASLYVSDVIKAKQAFAAERFNATPIDVSADFSDRPQRRFDMIFVGSLLTHLAERHFRQAINWLIGALDRNGILIVTLHGRHNTELGRSGDEQQWSESYGRYLSIGFLFDEFERISGIPYGCTRCTPSWIMSMIEANKQVRVLHFAEAGWCDYQDVLILQNRRIGLARDG